MAINLVLYLGAALLNFAKFNMHLLRLKAGKNFKQIEKPKFKALNEKNVLTF